MNSSSSIIKKETDREIRNVEEKAVKDKFRAKNFYTVAEIVSIERVDEKTVRRWIKDGYRGIKLKSSRSGRKYTILGEWITDFLLQTKYIGDDFGAVN